MQDENKTKKHLMKKHSCICLTFSSFFFGKTTAISKKAFQFTGPLYFLLMLQ